MESVHEEWRTIDGFAAYEVSNHGRVRSKDRTILDASGIRRNRRGKSLRPGVNGVGYNTVALSVPGKKPTSFCVHTLVARTFIGKQPIGYDVNHIDGNKINNHVANLEYVTHARNVSHACEIGILDNRGERHPLAKYTADQITRAYHLVANGMMHKHAAEVVGMSRGSVTAACSGKRWKHLNLSAQETTT